MYAGFRFLTSRKVEEPSTVNVLYLAGGTCPFCGYFNHPETNMRDAGDMLVFCSNCGEVFDGSERPRS